MCKMTCEICGKTVNVSFNDENVLDEGWYHDECIDAYDPPDLDPEDDYRYHG